MRKFYNDYILKLENIQTVLSRRHQKWSVLRLVLFIASLILIYFFTKGLFWGVPVLGILAFIYVLKVDSRLVEKLKLNKALLDLNNDELLNDERLTHPVFGDGKEFADTKHPFSFDIDIFGSGSLYQKINRTVTPYGSRKLAKDLSQINRDRNLIEDRQKAVNELVDLFDFRQTFIREKYLNPHIPDSDVIRWINTRKEARIPVHKKGFTLMLWLLPAIFTATFIMSISGILVENVPLMIFITQLFIVGNYLKKINAYHRRVEGICKSFRRDARLLAEFKEISPESEHLKNIYQVLIAGNHSAYAAIKQAESLFVAFDNRLNMVISVIFNGVYMRDLWLIKRFEKWIKQYHNKIPDWMNAIAELDAMVSLSNFNFNRPGMVDPEFSNSDFLFAENLRHPLIRHDKSVGNPVHIHNTGEILIVTGANMSGKSTYLRTVLVNLVLASTGSRVAADRFKYIPTDIFSSIRTFDNIVDDVSYFQAELIRLHNMVKLAEQGEPVVIAIDEPLKGTNSEDKRKGSFLLLKKLINLPVCGFVATHDLELKHLADNDTRFKLVCFEPDFEGDKVIYDYKLKPGVATRMNATILMKNMNLI